MAVFLLPGGFHVPEQYTAFADQLTAAGFQTFVVRHPTSNGARPPTMGFADDVAHASAELKRLVSAGHSTYIIAHSYGGMVATHAVTRELTREHRSSNNLPGGVTDIIYVAAFLTRQGETMLQHLGGPAEAVVEADGACILPDPATTFYHDCTPDQARRLAEMCVVMPAAAMTPVCSTEGWRTGPRISYVVCTADRTLPAVQQRQMIAGARRAGCDIREITVESGHSPFARCPETLVDIIQHI